MFFKHKKLKKEENTELLEVPNIAGNYEKIDLVLNDNLIGFKIDYKNNYFKNHSIHPIFKLAENCDDIIDTRQILNRIRNNEKNCNQYLCRLDYLNEFEDRIKKKLLLQYPSTYNKLFKQGSDLTKCTDNPFPYEVRKTYAGALNLLGDYYKQDAKYPQMQRFFTCNWDHNHIETVEKIMLKHDPQVKRDPLYFKPYGAIIQLLKDGNESYPIKFWKHGFNPFINILLKDLEKELLERGHPFYLDGDLASRINYIQDRCGIYVIDMFELRKKLPPPITYDVSYDIPYMLI